MSQTKKSKRDALVETAQVLFHREGIKATGIDTVLEKAGVAKRTLYNHFESKEALILATLERRDAEFMNMLKIAGKKYIKKQECDEKFAPVLAFFDAIDEWTQSDNFTGCMFINASAEYLEKDDPIHIACTQHKLLVINYLQELLTPLGLADNLELALQLALLTDGAIVNSHTTNIRQSVQVAKNVAYILLRLECKVIG